MPELPEVETIVKELKRTRAPKILGARFLNVWTDTPKIIKKPKTFEEFRNKIKNKKINKIWRRGKNVIFDLADGFSLLIHQKLTGHLLYGEWKLKNDSWQPKEKGPLADPINRFIRLMFWLDNGKMLALSDLRKFAKVELWKTEELKNSLEMKSLGPEPLDRSFVFKKFKEILVKKKGKIKQVLMDQSVIAGIGNIYSDEILWRAKIYPFKDVSKLNENELKRIYQAMKKILAKAIKLGGESISDFRRISGKKGGFDKERKVYRREGEKCPRCRAIIKRAKIGSRSAHFCPKCQL